jgi:Rap1a immunity proteins
MAWLAPKFSTFTGWGFARTLPRPLIKLVCLPVLMMATLLPPSTASANGEPARKMLSDCKTKWHICNLVLYGATRMHGQMGKTTGFVFCPPPTHDLTVTRQIVITYFQAHPELMDRPDIEIFNMAMANSFPCPKAP